jgi:PTH1 family peptidyl-tRNA hydrolase
MAWIVCGLGNPGAKYNSTPHNIGFLAVDALAAQLNGRWSSKFSAQIAQVNKAILVKPQQFMNLSGGPLKQVANYFKVPLENTLVVHDDIDLPFGTIKAKLGGGDAGHNGLRSITKSFGSNAYYRIRLGVGRPDEAGAVPNYVLGQFNQAQKTQLPEFLDDAVDAIELLMTTSLENVQMKFHTRRND